MLTLRQPFYAKDGNIREIEGTNISVGGMFMTQQEAIDDPVMNSYRGKQNKRRGTIAKKKRKTAHESRRRNRG